MTVTLSKEQKKFLGEMGVEESDVFDATGMNTAAYKAAMKKLDRLVAIGVVPCQEMGHTMRLRSGHCFQCNPANLSYHLRRYEAGYVYVAWSAKGKIVKVGTAGKAENRVKNVSSYRYGGQSDWKLELEEWCEEAGKVETAIHAALASFREAGRTYFKNGKDIKSREVFSCDLEFAKRTFRSKVALSRSGKLR